MPTPPPDTRARILSVALDEFLTHGIKKTSMEDVAAKAGLTRVTVYRHFRDKRELVRAAFLQIVDILRAAHDQIQATGGADPEAALDLIAARLSQLGGGDLPSGLNELRRLYPEVADEFHASRVEAIRQIFDLLLAQIRRQGRLREGLDPAVLRTYFITSVVNVLEHPDLTALRLSPAEIYNTVKAIFLHGILVK